MVLNIGSGQAIPMLELASGGTILGGTVADYGNGLQVDGTYWNALNGVTYEGALTQAGGKTKLAILLLSGMDQDEAAAKLTAAGGQLGALLGRG